MRSSGIEVREEVYRKLKGRNLIYAEEVSQYCEGVSCQLKPDIIILYGSTARGLHGKWSDVDLIVIADFEVPFIDRIGKLLELNETRAPIEPLGYTLNEFYEMLLKFNPLTLEAMKDGIPLIGEKPFAKLRSKFREMEKKGLKKMKVTWTTI